jgi:hypothetical protein
VATPTSRFTLHHFVDVSTLSAQIYHFAPNNTDARQPEDTDHWPPALILDYVYAFAVLRAWGQKDFIDYVQEQTRAAYYDNIEGESEDDNKHTTWPQPGRTDVRVVSTRTSAQTPRHDYSLHSRGLMQPTGRQKERRVDEIRDAGVGL